MCSEGVQYVFFVSIDNGGGGNISLWADNDGADWFRSRDVL